MDEIHLRKLFEIARMAGLSRYAGNKRMERKLRRAGSAGHKAYLRVLEEFQPGEGCRVTLAFRRPKAGGFEAHSVGFVKDAPLGAWAVTALAVTPVGMTSHPNRSAGHPAHNPDITTTAERVVWFAYSLSEDGTYRRPRDSELREEFGGRLISSSNDGASLVSCSPTDVWAFEDGSQAEIGCSIASAIAEAAQAVVREGDQTIGTWSMWTAPTRFLRELIGLAVEYGEASAQDEEGCTVTAVLVGQ